MKYRIYYGDGTESEDVITSARDVQIIMQVDPTRRPYFQSGSDYYVWRDDYWRGVDIFGLYDYLLDSHRRDRTMVLFGRTLKNAEYNAIYQKAKGDKTQFLPSERKP
jgi:hypothetical protein